MSISLCHSKWKYFFVNQEAKNNRIFHQNLAERYLIQAKLCLVLRRSFNHNLWAALNLTWIQTSFLINQEITFINRIASSELKKSSEFFGFLNVISFYSPNWETICYSKLTIGCEGLMKKSITYLYSQMTFVVPPV